MAGFLTSILGKSETYTKVTSRVGGLEVLISYPPGAAHNHIPDHIVRSISEAQWWLSLAFQEIRDYEASGKASEFYSERFYYSFGAQPTVQYSHEVSCVLDKINKGLSFGRLGVKVMDKKGRGGGVKGTVSADHLYFDAKVGSEIELDLGRLLSMPKRTTKTLIHEAGHVFGHLVDYAYADRNPDLDHLDWFDRFGNKAPKRVDLEWQKAKHNADSYAMFVFRLSRTQLKGQMPLRRIA